MTLFARLKDAAGRDWTDYASHEFVRRLGDGSLPEAAFRRYLVQDYLFLIQFARANALAVYKSRTLADMRAAQGALSAILDAELRLHVTISARWGLSPEDLDTAREARETLAYTRFVLDRGAAGDLLELQVALSPCVVGYAEIGRALTPGGIAAVPAEHPYRDWIADYAGAPYQDVARRARAQLDSLAQRMMPERRFENLAEVFAMACRLETDFWQMGLDAASDPR